MLDAQKERMECDRSSMERRLEIEIEKIELEKQKAAIKWKLEIEVKKERLQLARDAENAKVMLTDETFLDEHAKKWLAEKKKEIHDHRTLDAARAAVAAEQATRMHAEMAAEAEHDMQDEEDPWNRSTNDPTSNTCRSNIDFILTCLVP
ncbi:hypothetical protein D1007_51583 [Hordeum vulgare]|nr:hypothetical protein D1007_51583 [Hordeum vulgare]